MKHSFVICAYKESPFLEECIQSLEKQTVKSTIKMVTSTPNEYIADMAKKHNIELIVNEGQGGIVQDWNFGYKQNCGDACGKHKPRMARPVQSG